MKPLWEHSELIDAFCSGFKEILRKTLTVQLIGILEGCFSAA